MGRLRGAWIAGNAGPEVSDGLRVAHRARLALEVLDWTVATANTALAHVSVVNSDVELGGVAAGVALTNLRLLLVDPANISHFAEDVVLVAGIAVAGTGVSGSFA